MILVRKKSVVAKAVLWFKNGDHPHDYQRNRNHFNGDEHVVVTGEKAKELGWEGEIVRYYRHPLVSGDAKCKQCGHIMNDHGWIDTLEGGHIVCPGDWIIQCAENEYYPCKPDIFHQTHDIVRDDEVNILNKYVQLLQEILDDSVIYHNDSMDIHSELREKIENMVSEMTDTQDIDK